MKTVAFFVSLLLTPLSQAFAFGGYDCEIRGTISGAKLGFFYGGQIIGGEGAVRCVPLRPDGTPGAALERPVHLAIMGDSGGFDFTGIRQLEVRSVVIASMRHPDDLLGKFAV